MTGDPDEHVADLSSGFDELWEPAVAAEPGDIAPAGPGDTLSQATAGAGSPPPGRPAPGQQVPGEMGSRPPARRALASPVSVWQQSATAWQEAGIDWMRPAAAGARPAGIPVADDDPHTEPIPVLTADGSPRAARSPDPAGPSQPDRPSDERPSAGTEAGVAVAAEVNGVTAEAGAPATAETATVAASAPGVATGSDRDGSTAGYADAGSGSVGAGLGEGSGAGGASAGTAPGSTASGITQAEPGKKAGPGQGRKAGPGQGTEGRPWAGPKRPGRQRPALGRAGKLPPGGTRRPAPDRTRRLPPGGARPSGCDRAGGSRSWPSSHSSSSPGRWQASASPVPAAGRPSQSLPWSPRIRPPWRRTRNWPAERRGPLPCLRR